MFRPVARAFPGRILALIAFDTLLIVTAVAVAAHIRLGGLTWSFIESEWGGWKTLLVALVCQVCLYYADLYDLRVCSDRRGVLVRMARALGAASFVLAALYFWFPALIIGRGVFLLASFLVMAGVL